MTQYISTRGEEIANSLSHGVMALLILFVMPFAAVWSYLHGGVTAAVSVAIYLISIFGMTLSSTLYHAMPLSSRAKEVLHILDHIFIYIAIAGTYTPIALCVIGGWQGGLITTLQWTMVLFGIFYKSLCHKSIAWLSLTIYLVMGWTVVFFAPALINNASTPLLILVVAGGVLYSLGAWVYARKGFRFHHLVWHLFINAALLLHLIAILFYI